MLASFCVELYIITGSSWVEKVHHEENLLKQEREQLKVVSGSPWNWMNSLCSLYSMISNKNSWESLTYNASYKEDWDQTSCKEEAKSSPAALKRLRPELYEKNILHLLSFLKAFQWTPDSQLLWPGIHAGVCFKDAVFFELFLFL